MSTYYILFISWTIKCVIIIDARCKYEDHSLLIDVRYAAKHVVCKPTVLFAAAWDPIAVAPLKRIVVLFQTLCRKLEHIV